jgi:hypothetical protein
LISLIPDIGTIRFNNPIDWVWPRNHHNRLGTFPKTGARAFRFTRRKRVKIL